jgi:hypothetical protein
VLNLYSFVFYFLIYLTYGSFKQTDVINHVHTLIEHEDSAGLSVCVVQGASLNKLN